MLQEWIIDILGKEIAIILGIFSIIIISLLFVVFIGVAIDDYADWK